MEELRPDLELPATQASPLGRWLRDPDGAAFWLLIAACLVPVWTVAYFPSQDGPAHVYNAMILRDYHGPQGAGFRTYFELSNEPEPNLLGHWLMAGLMVLVKPWVAEKLLISAYIVLLPLSARYVVRAVAKGSGFLAFLSFPLIYSLALHKGLYNFSLSLPLFFFFIGYWLRCDGRFDLRRAGALMGLSLLLYFAHVVSLLEAYITVGLLAVVQVVLDLAARKPVERTILSRAFLPLAMLAPTLALVAHFFHQQTGNAAPMPPFWQRIPGFPQMVRELLNFSSLISYRYRGMELQCARCVMLLFAGCAMYGLWRLVIRRKTSSCDLLLSPVGATILLYFIIPNTAANGGLISPRLMLFVYFLLIPWFACTAFPQWGRAAVRIGAALLCLLMLNTYVNRYREINVYLADYAECSGFIKPGSTLLPICLSGNLGTTTKDQYLHHGLRFFLHASGNMAAELRLVDLSNYEATQGYFPTSFRDEMTPERRLGEYGQGLLKYPEQTGGKGRIDYVLVWKVDEKNTAQMPLETLKDLDIGYQLIHTTQHGWGKLYQRKAAVP